MTEELVARHFQPHEGTVFRLLVDGEPGPRLRLTEITIVPADGDGRSFSLVFRQEDGRPFIQRMYDLRHEGMGDVSVFLVPLLPDPDGRAYYESVFNRLPL